MKAKEVIVKETIIKTRTRITITITIITTIATTIETRINKIIKEEMVAKIKLKLSAARLTRELISSLTSNDMIGNCRSCRMKLMQVLGIRYSLEDSTII